MKTRVSPNLEAYLADISLFDVQSMNLLLEGSSIIDWARPNFSTSEEAERLLRVNGYDVHNPQDMDRFLYLITESAAYLEQTFGFMIPSELLHLQDPTEIFLIASDKGHPQQRLAWMLVKVLHVLNHVQGRELGHILATSDHALFQKVQDTIAQSVDQMRHLGIGVHEYQCSMKTKESLLTKLLSKRNTIAAQIFDKVRFRIILESRSDLFPALVYLTREAIPFNYVIPGETRNDILEIHREVMNYPHLLPKLISLAKHSKRLVKTDDSSVHEHVFPFNPATEASYKVINFVVDLPIRARALLEEYGLPYTREMGGLVFVMVEFQVFDRETYQNNESGPAKHEYYKDRQRKMVLSRLVKGSSDN